MENPTPRHLIWKITVPVIAVLLAIAVVIYTGGFDNFLKLLGIKASQLQTIELTTTAQLLGNSPEDSWLLPNSPAYLDGVSVFDSFTSVPADPNAPGFVMPIYSLTDLDGQVASSHAYISPVVDLGAPTTLSSLAVTLHTPTGATLVHGYRSAATPEELTTASFIPVELATSDTEVATVESALNASVSRYLQVKVEFLGDTFENRSAVYGWKLQYGVVEAVAEPSDATTETPLVVSLAFAENASLPATTLTLYSTATGTAPVLTLSDLTAEALLPIYTLPNPIPQGHYVLVLTAPGYQTMVIPFVATGSEPLTLTLPAYQPLPVGFDLNLDGVINSLDVNLILSAMGSQQ